MRQAPAARSERAGRSRRRRTDTRPFHPAIGYAANPSLYDKVPYDPVNYFDAVAIGATTMQVLVIRRCAADGQELVALIRANPGKYSYSSAGVGTGANLTGELFRTSLDPIWCTCLTAAACGHCRVGGRTHAALVRVGRGDDPAASGRQAARARGRRPEAVAGVAGHPNHRRGGLSRGECDAVVGVLAPAKTPKDIITLLNREIAVAVRAAGRSGAADDARFRNEYRQPR